MALSPAQLDTFRLQGWLVVEGVFSAADMDRTATRATELAEVALVRGELNSPLVERDSQGKAVAPRKVNRPFDVDRDFGRLIYNSQLPAILGELMGIGALFFTDQIFMKPPRHGSPKAYHQDNAYFLMHPDDHVITAWIAMDDVDEGNGCLRYINGSHRGPILPSTPVPGKEYDLTPDPALIDLSKEALALVKKGGVVFHHAGTLHCSGPNTSDRWRRGYATHWIGADVTCETNLIDSGYFRRPDMFAGMTAM